MGKDTEIRRYPDRGRYDTGTINRILDEGTICHASFSIEGVPYNIPMLHVRIGSALFIHMSTESRIYRTLKEGAEACITVTLLDGIVLAKSAYSTSLNYRSAMLFGKLGPVTDQREKMMIAEALLEKVARGRWNDCRHPSEAELKVTAFLKMPIEVFSAKVRAGPPGEKDIDLKLPYWSGVIPLSTVRGKPVTSEIDSGRIRIPQYLATELE